MIRNSCPIIDYVWNRYKKATPVKNAVVEMRITYKKRQKFISTGIRLLPKEWWHGQVVNRVDALVLNQTLDELLVDVRTVILNMMKEGHIDIFAIPAALDRLKWKDTNFIEFCRQRSEFRKYGKAKDSQARYDRFLRFFVEWGKIKDFADINEQNIIDFDGWLKERGLQTYSRWNNYHRFVNGFILDAMEEKLIRKNPYKNVHINKDKVSRGIERCLTPKEFRQLKEADIPSDRLQKTRDLFLFQAYMAFSYSSLKNFKKDMIKDVDGVKVYQREREKTGFTFTVPVPEPALLLLAKYKGKLPVINNAAYNKQLKEIAECAGIKKNLTTHYARHTQATALFNAGVPMHVVSKILGHSSSRITEQIYAKVLDETMVVAAEKSKINND